MSYNYDKVNLVEGSLNQIDDAPRYPLGTRVHDANGREYVYVKATASLTPGTAVAGVKRSATTVVSSSAFDGGFKIGVAHDLYLLVFRITDGLEPCPYATICAADFYLL